MDPGLIIRLDDVKTVADIVGTLVTAAAVIVGGLWAYFRFVKNRTYNPHLAVALHGQWREHSGVPLFHGRITVGNIGASKVELRQRGSGLMVSSVVSASGSDPATVGWDTLGVWPVLEKHAWIEPGETVSDDLLLDLGVEQPVPLLLESRLVGNWPHGRHDIAHSLRRVMPVEGRLDDTEAPTQPPRTADVELSLSGLQSLIRGPMK